MRCFRFIAAEKAQFPISLLCRVLGVSRSGFYAWQGRNSSERALAGAWLCERIREIHERSRQTYGARRVHAAFGYRGVRVGRKRVERLMRGLGLSGLVPKRYRRTTIRLAGVRVADDLARGGWRAALGLGCGWLAGGRATPGSCRARAGEACVPDRPGDLGRGQGIATLPARPGETACCCRGTAGGWLPAPL